ncbi:hypothetical protein GS531_24900, partial [Rhodococcus hoagii]|nr:hypothetical protein [Prescottella equi]
MFEEFEDWPVVFSPAPRRVVDPPVPVMVDVLLAIGQSDERPANELPLRVRAEALNVDCRVPVCSRRGRGPWAGVGFAHLSFSIHWKTVSVRCVFP